MSPNGEYYLDSASSLTSPTQRTLHAKDGKQLDGRPLKVNEAQDRPRTGGTGRPSGGGGGGGFRSGAGRY